MVIEAPSSAYVRTESRDRPASPTHSRRQPQEEPMNDRQQTQPIDPAELPEAITRYLDARQVQDTPRALSAFAADAVVIDEGKA